MALRNSAPPLQLGLHIALEAHLLGIMHKLNYATMLLRERERDRERQRERGKDTNKKKERGKERACMYACMHVCMYACMHTVYVCKYIYIYIHTTCTYIGMDIAIIVFRIQRHRRQQLSPGSRGSCSLHDTVHKKDARF